MAITGGAKFFKRNKALASDGATAVASPSGSSSAASILDRNRVTFYRSSGSNDVTAETVTVTFSATKVIDRAFLIDHNFETFTLKYDADGVPTWTDFTTVVGLDGALGGGVTETTFSDDTAYYEFDSVTAHGIQIIATTTQTANEEKYLNELITTEELGTMAGYPEMQPFFSNNERDRTMLSGKHSVTKTERFYGMALGFDPYPGHADYNADLTLAKTIFDRLESTLVWLCGGRRNISGTTYFGFTLESFRLRDVFNMQTIGERSVSYVNNVFVAPVEFEMQMIEVVD